MASDHIDELGFAADARAAIKAARGFNAARGSFDWLHVNSATYVGPNQWFDQGDKRFAPNNVIISSREASLLAIVGRDGSIVWRLGPDFSAVEGAAGDPPDHRPASRAPDPERTAWRGEPAGVRQRRSERLRLRQPDRA